jgi:hypothetical protein
MIAICGTCHDLIHRGAIDYQTQLRYKSRLKERNSFSDSFPPRFSWDDLKKVIMALYDDLAISDPSQESKYDFTEVNLEEKNELNQLSEGYFSTMKDHHEPYFGRIEEFLKNPINTDIVNIYHQIFDELRFKIALKQEEEDRFEAILMLIYDSAKDNAELNGKRQALNILLSFMYFHCDIGRKS